MTSILGKGGLSASGHIRQAAVLTGFLVVFSLSGACSDPMILFDGNSLEGWAQTGPGYMEVDPKERTLTTRGGMGMLWYYDRKFKDFELELEWKATDKEDNSGVFVRFPNIPKRDRPESADGKRLVGPWGAVNEGYEIQICDDGSPDSRTGAIYSFFPSTEVASNPPGEWNAMKIRVVGQHYEVWVNGKKVGDYTGERGLEGYIGIQNHGDSDVITYRNIRIRDVEESK